ncbi:MAG: hypothetical protein A2V84_10100 [Chloroflexi bacterium RBG_16_70_13]|nr:MAG: hypothetical protein A2V84_10100 [Chloroflexi bacterium RBG_16_70_13]
MIRLNSVDFPTFGLPTIATTGSELPVRAGRDPPRTEATPRESPVRGRPRRLPATESGRT